jgi:hypothetical protein
MFTLFEKKISDFISEKKGNLTLSNLKGQSAKLATLFKCIDE